MPINPFDTLLNDLLKVGILTPLILLFRLLLPPDGTLGVSSFFFPIPRNPDEDDEIPLLAGDPDGCGIGEVLYCCCCDRGTAPDTGALLYMAPAFAESLETKLLEKLRDGAVRVDVDVSAV